MPFLQVADHPSVSRHHTQKSRNINVIINSIRAKQGFFITTDAAYTYMVTH